MKKDAFITPLLQDTNQKQENPIFNAITLVGYILKLTECRSRSLTLQLWLSNCGLDPKDYYLLRCSRFSAFSTAFAASTASIASIASDYRSSLQRRMQQTLADRINCVSVTHEYRWIGDGSAAGCTFPVHWESVATSINSEIFANCFFQAYIFLYRKNIT